VKLVKASRDVAGSAAASERAASAGDALSDSALRPTIAKTATPTSVTRTATAAVRRRRRCARLPGLLDQRLDEGLDLLAADRVVLIGGTGWYYATVTSIMLRQIDKRDPTDLYEQVAAEIRRAIADGEAKPGERLPPSKDLAAVLGVNTNTVLRALRLLRDEGLLEFRRGRGISVSGTPERGAVVQRAKELVEFARQQGYHLDELVEIIEDLA
jgi:GntR family transcriptional regulator